MGSGFDSVGIAFQKYNHLWYVEIEEGLQILINKNQGLKIPTDENNLIYKTMKDFFDMVGKPMPGVRLIQEDYIPHTRGLGSSAACIVAGLIAANDLSGCHYSTDDLSQIAAQIEGHPDNSTPALLGGFVAAAMEGEHVFWAQCPIPEELGFVAVIPDFELKTADARRALPDQYVRADGVYNLSRSALMAISMAQGKLENLRIAAEDRLHQPYRLKLIPGAEQVFDFFDKQQAYAAYISGAGSTLMGLVPADRMKDICQAARTFLDAQGLCGWQVLGLRAGEGARIVTAEEGR